jgi:outer membrane protein OmpU
LALHRVEGPVRLWGGWQGEAQAGLGLETRDKQMKKVLLGTTALVAAGLFAGEARAEFDATVNGSWNTAYGFVDEDDGAGESGDGRQNQAINQDWEVHFRAQQTLDNGIVVGGRVELEGASNGGNDSVLSQSAGNDQIDERWLYFRGGFGEIRVGDEDDARKQKGYTAPDPTGFIFGVNSPTFTFNNIATGQVVSSNTTIPNLENDSAKIIYFTPSFGGFQLAVSYAPDGTQDRSSFGTGGTEEGQVSNAWSVGADYSGEFGGFTIGAGGGYSQGSAETVDADPSIWAVGLNLGFAGFTVGGSVAFTDLDVGGDDEATVYDVGVTYTIDAVTVGLGWSHGEYEDEGEDDSLDHMQLAASYALGEGVTLAAMVGLFEYDDEGPLDNDNEGWQAGIGTGINF